MNRLVVAVAVLTWFGYATPLPADEPPSQAQSVQRNGRWLRTGIHEYQRFVEKAANQTPQEAQSGVMMFSYVRGVLDATWSTTFKARVQEGVLANAEKSSDPEVRKSAARLAATHQSANYFAPLWNTKYLDAKYQADQYAQVISNYLDAHPEEWGKDAQDIIENALIAEFSPKVK